MIPTANEKVLEWVVLNNIEKRKENKIILYLILIKRKSANRKRKNNFYLCICKNKCYLLCYSH